MPDPHEVAAEDAESKEERRALRSLRKFAALLEENRPDRETYITHVNLVRRDGGFLLVIKGVDGLNRRIMFRDVLFVVDFVAMAVSAIESGAWKDDKPWSGKSTR